MKSKTPTLEELAAISETSVSTLKRYRKQGVNILDPGAIRAHGEAQKNHPRSMDSEDMRAAKLRKTILDGDKIEHALGVLRGQFIPVQQVRADMLRIAAAVRAEFQMLCVDVPTWEGLPAHELEKRIKAGAEKIFANLHDSTSTLYRAKDS